MVNLLYTSCLKEYFSLCQSRLNIVHDRTQIKIGLNKIKVIGSLPSLFKQCHENSFCLLFVVFLSHAWFQVVTRDCRILNVSIISGSIAQGRNIFSRNQSKIAFHIVSSVLVKCSFLHHHCRMQYFTILNCEYSYFHNMNCEMQYFKFPEPGHTVLRDGFGSGRNNCNEKKINIWSLESMGQHKQQIFTIISLTFVCGRIQKINGLKI